MLGVLLSAVPNASWNRCSTRLCRFVSFEAVVEVVRLEIMDIPQKPISECVGEQRVNVPVQVAKAILEHRYFLNVFDNFCHPLDAQGLRSAEFVLPPLWHTALGNSQAHLRDQGHRAVNFQQAGFEHTSERFEHAARDQVEVSFLSYSSSQPPECAAGACILGLAMRLPLLKFFPAHGRLLTSQVSGQPCLTTSSSFRSGFSCSNLSSLPCAPFFF